MTNAHLVVIHHRTQWFEAWRMHSLSYRNNPKQTDETLAIDMKVTKGIVSPSVYMFVDVSVCVWERENVGAKTYQFTYKKVSPFPFSPFDFCFFLLFSLANGITRRIWMYVLSGVIFTSVNSCQQSTGTHSFNTGISCYAVHTKRMHVRQNTLNDLANRCNKICWMNRRWPIGEKRNKQLSCYESFVRLTSNWSDVHLFQD